MPYLDGKKINLEIISPRKHRFIGMFRPPNPMKIFSPNKPSYTFKEWQENPRPTYSCTCHALMDSDEKIMKHWLQGHFDEPMYETIPKPKTEIIPEELEPVPKSSFLGPKLPEPLHQNIIAILDDIRQHLSTLQMNSSPPKKLPIIAELLANILNEISMHEYIIKRAEYLFENAFFEGKGGKPFL